MSPYLHFGQISPLYLALEILKTGRSEDAESFLEELIVRRELGMTYVHFTAITIR
jgi:deoxyribodipyrimidine photo-lyase